jgi:HrpA-like RNA helicase
MNKYYDTSLREGDINKLNGLPFTKKGIDIWEKLQGQKLAEPNVIKEFNQKVLDNNITIVSAGTGVGKTVLAPAHLLKLFNYKIKIGLTQPKQILAKSNSEFIAEGVLDTKPGKYVSYQFRFNNTVNKYTKITVMTDAIMVNKLITDPEEYDIVMIDEIHERNINMDFILFLINHYFKNVEYWKKNKITKNIDPSIYIPKKLNNPTKFILLSATLDATSLINYFKKSSNVNVGLFEVSGRAFPITDYFFGSSILKNLKDYNVNNYLIYIKDSIEKLLNNNEFNDGDILVFLPTKKDIQEMIKYIGKKYKNLYVGGLYSGIDFKKQDLAIHKDLYKTKGLGDRKIIFSTPVAEAGLTVEGIKYVFETGVTNSMTIDQYTGFRTLKVTPINISSVIQRCGRGGRTGPGTCFHLYPKEYYEKEFGKIGNPEINRINVVKLLMKTMNMTGNINTSIKILNEKMLSNIDLLILEKNSLILYKNNIINTSDGSFSKIGELINSMGLDFDLAILVMNGFLLKINNSITIIASMMSLSYNIKDFFKFKKIEVNGRMVEQNKPTYNKFKNRYGDPIVFLNLFKFFYSNFQKKFNKSNKDYYQKKLEKFCNNNLLNYIKFKDLMKVIYNTQQKINNAYKKNGGKIEIEKFPDEKILNQSENKKIIIAFKNTYSENKATIDPIRGTFNVNRDKNMKLERISPFLEKKFKDKKQNNIINNIIGFAELLIINNSYKSSCDFSIGTNTL